MKTTNKKITRILSGIFLLSFISLVSFAQGPDRQRMSPDEMAKKQTEQMIKKLSLDDEQATQVTEINTKYAEKMKGMKDMDREERREQMERLRMQQNDELKSVLTEDQYTTFEEMQASRKENRGGNMKRGGRRK